MKRTLVIPAIKASFKGYSREDIPGLLLLMGMAIASLTGSGWLKDGLMSKKEVIFVVSTGLALCYHGMMWLRQEGHMFSGRPVFSEWSLPRLAAVLFMLYSVGNGCYHTMSDVKLPMHLLIRCCSLIYFLLLQHWLAKDEKRAQLIQRLFFLIFLAQWSIGLLQLADVLASHHSLFRVTGPFFNPGPYAIYLIAVLVAWFGGVPDVARIPKNAVRRGLLLLLSAGFIVFLFYLKSRSSLIGGLAGTGFILLKRVKSPLSFILGRIRRYKLLLCICALFPAIVAGYSLYRAKPDSARGRLLTWTVCGNLIKQHFITGTGAGNFPVIYGREQHALFQRDAVVRERYGQLAGDVRYAFNDELQVAVEGGCMGLFLWVVLLACMTSGAIRSIRSEKGRDGQSGLRSGTVMAGTAGIIVLVTAGLFSYPLEVLPLNQLFWTFCAMASSNAKPLWKSGLRGKWTRRVRWGMGLLYMCFGSLLCYAGSRTALAMARWNRIGRSQTLLEGSYSGEFTALYTRLSDNGLFLTEYARACMDDKNYDHAVFLLEMAKQLTPDPEVYYCLGEAYEAIGKYDLALLQYRYVAGSIPGLLKPFFLITRLYYRNGDTSGFHFAAREALDHPVKLVTGDVEGMRAQILLWLKLEQLPDHSKQR